MKKFTTQAIIHSFLLLTPYFSLIYAQAPDTLWTKAYGEIDSDGGYAVQQTSDSGYIVAGRTLSFGAGSADVWLLKMASEPGIAEKEFFQNTAFLEINPNPFRQTTTIKLQTPGIKNQIELKIYDVTGHLVKDFNYISGNLLEQVTWTGEDNSGAKLPSGIYLLKFKFNNFTATRKLILLS